MSDPIILKQETLNFTDLTGAQTGCTTLGSNKFWKGWVQRNADGTHNFECRWGSTGTAGSDKGSVRGIPEHEALKQLDKKVKEKVNKGYTRLETRSIDEEVKKAAVKGIDLTTQGGNGQTGAPVPVVKTGRTFHPEVERLLGIMYGSTSTVVRSGLSAQAGSTEDNPIGNLSDRQLDLGGSILDEIQAHLDRHFGGESPSNANQTLPLQRDGVPTSEILNLTNRFMSNVPREIPRENRGKTNLHRLVISSYERLEEQRKFLTLLRDAHLAKATFQAAAQAHTANDKVGVWYDGLNCLIEHVDAGEADYKRVADIFNTAQSRKNANWWSGGRSRLRLTRVWRFLRNGTDQSFENFAREVCGKPGAVGRVMAWHGTRTENLLGIGKSGLLMPENLPRGVHISGKIFGRGIYHAPAWNATKTDKVCGNPTDGTNGALKSMNYTSAQGAYYGAGNTSQRGYMYLEEVALGLPEVRTSTCTDQHRPAGWPRNDFTFACSQKIGTLAHDEIVTYNERAQVFRFLVEVEIH